MKTWPQLAGVLKASQLRSVSVQIQRVRVGIGSSMCHLLPSQNLLHSNLNLLSTLGILKVQFDKLSYVYQ